MSSVLDIKFDKDKLKSNFVNFKQISNLNVLKCYKLLLNNQLVKNKGCIIISIILFFELIGIFVFYCYEFNILKNKIKVILESKKSENKKIINNDKVDKNKRTSKLIKTKRGRVKLKCLIKKKEKVKSKKSFSKIKIKDIQAPPKSKFNNKLSFKKQNKNSENRISEIYQSNRNSFNFFPQII